MGIRPWGGTISPPAWAFKSGTGLLLLRLGARRNRGLRLRGRHAQHRLAVLALDQLLAQLVGHRQDLAAFEVRTQQLDGHSKSPMLLSARVGGHLNGETPMSDRAKYRFFGEFDRGACKGRRVDDGP